MAKKKNEVAAPGQFSMDDVPNLLAQVTNKMDALRAKYGGDSDDTPADGNLDGFGDLKANDDIPTLVRAHSAIVGREAAYKVSAKALDVNLTTHPFKLSGSSAPKWIKFIKRRIGEVTYAADLAKLQATKDKLTKYVSKEQQLNSDMQDIAAMLAD